VAKVTVQREGLVGAPAGLTYRLIADDEHHQQFLPAGFSDFKTVEGGRGAGTVHSFKLSAGGRTRAYTLRVDEPETGRVITETDLNSSLVTTFTVTPTGEHCRVSIATTWDGAGGIGGFFERLFAPRVISKIYADELQRLDQYAQSQASAGGSDA
jgi:hypothetical protein